MRGRREPAHVDADLGDDDVGAEVLDARDRRDQLDGGAKGPQAFLHLRIDRRHGGFESVDVIEMKAQQEAVLLRHAAAKGFAQLLLRALHPPIGKTGQFGGVGFARNQRLDHGPAALAHHVGEHRIQFDVGVLQRLLHAQHVARLLANQLFARAQQGAHLLSLRIRHEARPDQAMCQQFAQPRRVIDVALAARHILHVRGVCQHQRRPA